MLNEFSLNGDQENNNCTDLPIMKYPDEMTADPQCNDSKKIFQLEMFF